MFSILLASFFVGLDFRLLCARLVVHSFAVHSVFRILKGRLSNKEQIKNKVIFYICIVGVQLQVKVRKISRRYRFPEDGKEMYTFKTHVHSYCFAH